MQPERWILAVMTDLGFYISPSLHSNLVQGGLFDQIKKEFDQRKRDFRKYESDLAHLTSSVEDVLGIPMTLDESRIHAIGFYFIIRLVNNKIGHKHMLQVINKHYCADFIYEI